MVEGTKVKERERVKRTSQLLEGPESIALYTLYSREDSASILISQDDARMCVAVPISGDDLLSRKRQKVSQYTLYILAGQSRDIARINHDTDSRVGGRWHSNLIRLSKIPMSSLVERVAFTTTINGSTKGHFVELVGREEASELQKRMPFIDGLTLLKEALGIDTVLQDASLGDQEESIIGRNPSQEAVDCHPLGCVKERALILLSREGKGQQSYERQGH